jgi:vancomycin resistance protein YoaR
VTFTKPNITSDVAASLLFRDTLGSAYTYFSTGTQNGKNRGFNMGLAADKINNLILAPGQEFSYNEVVGPRDLEHGFKLAHVYSAGKIIDGVGGGICQVSSTMYNAVLKADLQVKERRNHSFTVGYVPLGQDATAYYGGTDFRFVNSTNWPLKLIAKISGNKVSFSILGTNEDPGKAVIISNKILKETPFEVKYTDDPTLSAGVTKEQQEGMKGYVVETYKTIKVDGKVISQTKLHTSTYKAYAQIVLRGTKPVSSTGGKVTPSSGTIAPADDVEPAEPVETAEPGDPPILDEVEQPVDEAPDAAVD